MKYISIDIETLGLNPEFCDVVEFGAVCDDMKSPIENLPRFHCYLTKPNNYYRGDAYAMSMHHEILRRISNREHGYTYTPSDMLDEVFAAWTFQQGYSFEDSIVIAGKNFASFDLEFLKKIGFGKKFNYDYRFLDPSSMFMTKEDHRPPSLKECLFRAGVEKEVAHTAIADAIDVIKCIRFAKCKG